MKKSIYEIVLDSFAPERCYFCGKLSSPICEKCFKSYCRFGKILSKPNSVISKEFYLSERSGELQKIVDEFKLQSKRQNCRPLVRLFVDFLLSKEVFLQNRDKIVLIPVPTLSSHIRERGFDHTEIFRKYKLFKKFKKLHNGVQTLKLVKFKLKNLINLSARDFRKIKSMSSLMIFERLAQL